MLLNNLRIIIPSRKRTRSAMVANAVFSDLATLVVAENEHEDYKTAGFGDIVCHPDEVTGIGPIRQWILDNFDDQIILQCDDDITGLWCKMGLNGYRLDQQSTLQVLVNAANVAVDMGVHVFGFSQSWDVRKYNPSRPIVLSAWMGGAIGFVGRDSRLRYSENKLRADIDYSLQSLLVHRIVYQDDRYSFIQSRFENTGGNAINRSMDRDKAEREALLRKWRKYLRATVFPGGTLVMRLNVERRRPIKIEPLPIGRGGEQNDQATL